jgi:hypothetical protein
LLHDELTLDRIDDAATREHIDDEPSDRSGWRVGSIDHDRGRLHHDHRGAE